MRSGYQLILDDNNILISVNTNEAYDSQTQCYSCMIIPTMLSGLHFRKIMHASNQLCGQNQ
jgi:hypothetical protein